MRVSIVLTERVDPQAARVLWQLLFTGSPDPDPPPDQGRSTEQQGDGEPERLSRPA